MSRQEAGGNRPGGGDVEHDGAHAGVGHGRAVGVGLRPSADDRRQNERKREHERDDADAGTAGAVPAALLVSVTALLKGRILLGIIGLFILPVGLFGAIRVRMVEYSPGYLADHWCEKGHILLCLEGELCTELSDGRTFVLTAGMSYQVADDAESHRSQTVTGAKLFIVD